MKKKWTVFLAVLVTLIMILSTGCGKVEEKVAEEIIEQSVGENVDVDISGDNVSIESDDGIFKAGSDLEWPTDAMKDLPKPKAVVTGIMTADENNSCTVTFTDMDIEDAKDYAQQLSDMGFKNGMNIMDEDSIIVIGKRDDSCEASFIYNVISKEGTISLISNLSQ